MRLSIYPTPQSPSQLCNLPAADIIVHSGECLMSVGSTGQEIMVLSNGYGALEYQI
jgi:hypothetical protein